jgi:peptidyl-dipeptidase Dcp
MPPTDRNPLLSPWEGPHALPPFSELKVEHFEPAFARALAQHRAEVDAIAHQPAPPEFDNTIAALDAAGALLARIDAVFSNLCSSETSPDLQAVERQMAPVLAAHGNAIYLNEALFRRIDTLHTKRDALELDAESMRLLERVHLDFVRAGAKLAPQDRARHAQIVERLAALTTRFAQNVLADESRHTLVLHDEAELAGLPAFVRNAARQAARERGLGAQADDAAGPWVVTPSRSHVLPFLTFSSRRDLRENAWRLWVSRGEHAGEHDNRPIAREILALRQEQARLHGMASYADFALADSMARTQDAVAQLLQRVWQPALRMAERDRAALLDLARCSAQEAGASPSEAAALSIEEWDWRYYAEKLRQRDYELDEAELKPYFPLDAMVRAAFDCAQRLFGLHFVARRDLPLYHPDVNFYEVYQGAREAGGRLIGLFLHDNFARPSKRSGAWMGTYRLQSRRVSGERVLPLVVNNNNFAKAAEGEPTLLSVDDARTLFHEFGHAMHGLLSDVRYQRLAGTNVLRDFVELPSQLFEHWIGEPEVLRRHARHHRTGEPLPEVFIERLQAARRFNQAYETLRYTAAALVDMAVHACSQGVDDIVAFEAAELQRHGLPPGIGINHRLVHFQHLFSGASYAAGYYVYLWAEVLDCDAWQAFAEAGGPFDPRVAQRLREHILSRGDSCEPGEAYRAFRGRDAQVEPMLRERGLLAEAEA